MALLIKNGRVLDPNPATKTDAVLDLLIEDGKIVKIAPGIQADNAEQLDASGCFVMPGFIDLHVHLRDPGFEQKETVITGVAAAVVQREDRGIVKGAVKTGFITHERITPFRRRSILRRAKGSR